MLPVKHHDAVSGLAANLQSNHDCESDSDLANKRPYSHSRRVAKELLGCTHLCKPCWPVPYRVMVAQRKRLSRPSSVSLHWPYVSWTA